MCGQDVRLLQAAGLFTQLPLQRWEPGELQNVLLWKSKSMNVNIIA